MIAYIKGFIDGLRPILKIELSEWGNKYRKLSPVASSRPGDYDINVTPPLIEIADCLSESSPIQEVIFKKASQIGATEIGNNWVGYTVHIAPSAMLMIMPTDETVKTNSQIRIDPMITDTPVLRERIAPARSRDSRNTIKQKSFPNGVLLFKGANSPTALRSLPVGKVMLDELSAYPANIGGEGSGMKLAKARTRTYPNRKIYAPSTPTVDGVCAITYEYENTDKRRYYVPCIHCGAETTIDWEYMVWEKDEKEEPIPESIRMKCPHCHGLIEERHKMTIIKAGRWIATNPDYPNKRRRGYHLSALYSTLGYTWADALSDYADGLKNENDMITWTNTVLGLEYKISIEAPDWNYLYSRRENYARRVPPRSTAFITMGVDVQQDRLEIELVAWCKGKVSYSLDYIVIPGKTDMPDSPVWGELDKLVNSDFVREDGAVLPIAKVCIDSSDNTNVVYSVCRGYDPGKVVPIKGRAQLTTSVGIPKTIDFQDAGASKAFRKIQLWTVGVDVIKTELYGWLRQIKMDGKDEPVGYCHFPQYDEHYFKMLTAEQKQVVTDKKGYKKQEWILPSHARNEALDCRVYNRAGAAMVGMDRWDDEDWDEIINQYPTREELENPERFERGSENNGGDYIGNTDNWV